MRPLRILVDMPNMCHRFRHVHGGLRSSRGRPTGVAYGVLNAMINLIEDFAPMEIVGCWDPSYNQQPSWRYKVYSGYKAARNAKHKKASAEEQELMSEFHNIQVPDTTRMLCAFGIPQIQTGELEADDVIAMLVHRTEREKGSAIVVSTDKDMLQLVKVHVCRVFNPMTREMYYQDDAGRLRMASQGEAIAESPRMFLWQRILSGDTSDSIPGIPGVGDVRAINLVKGTVALPSDNIIDWLTRNHMNSKDRYSVKAVENIALLAVNEVLMDIQGQHAYKWLSEVGEAALNNLRCVRFNFKQRTPNCKESEFGVFIKDDSTAFGKPVYRFFHRREFEFICYPDRVDNVVNSFQVLNRRRKELYMTLRANEKA